MIIKVVLLTITVMIASALLTHTNSAFADQNNVDLYAKGIMDKSGPFAGESFRTIISDNSATVIHPGHGVELIRMDITPNQDCGQTGSRLCFNATVTSTKNTSIHQVGDKISVMFDLASKKEVVTINSGQMRGTIVTIDLSKLDLRLNGPYTIKFMQEGGFAGIQKTITIDTMSAQLTNDGIIIPIDEDAVSKITSKIKKAKFFDIEQESYPPIEGSADYFTYSIQITQGEFQKTISWTDTSKNVPDKLTALKDAINDIVNAQHSTPNLDTIQVTMAKSFLTTGPTFAFDGVGDSIKVQDVKILESFPEQFLVTLDFDCLHGGYGDRTGQMVTQTITPHVIVITIIDNNVTSAIIDDKWDELNQKSIEQ